MGTKLLVVCLGGAVGSGLRYLISVWMTARFPGSLPVGTLAVNVIGSFALMALTQVPTTGGGLSPEMRLALSTGLLGGFTTYSTFNYETTALLQKGSIVMAGAYVVVTLSGCLVAGWVGLLVGRAMAS